MPHNVIGEVVAQVAQEATEVAVKKVHREIGWRGCLLLTMIIVGIGVGLYFALR